MLKYCFIFLIFISNTQASNKDKIIENLQNTENLNFEFEQNINGKIESGNCTIQYPKKIHNYDMYDGVFTINKIVSESKKKPIILDNLYKELSNTNKLETNNIYVGKFEIGMEVLVTDPNYVIFEDTDGIKKLELVGKITEIDESFITIGIPDEPNVYTKLIFERGAPSLKIKKKYIELFNKKDQNLFKRINNENINLLYPEDDSGIGIIGDQNYINLTLNKN